MRLCATLTLTLVMPTLLAAGCGSGRDTPVVAAAPPNDFVNSIVVERVLADDAVSVLAEVTEIPVNTGFVVQFELLAAAALPSELESRTVLHPDKWPADVVFFPRGGISADVTDLKGSCPIFSRSSGPPKSHSDIMINSFYSSFWSYCGFQETVALKQPASVASRLRWKKNKAPWFWTYFCVGQDQVGEFVYEIRIYPTAAWKSTVRFELGEPVVLHRGLLRVVPAPESK